MQTEQIISLAIGLGLAILITWLQERGKEKRRREEAEADRAATRHSREELLRQSRMAEERESLRHEMPAIPTAAQLPEEGVRSTAAYEQAEAMAATPGTPDEAELEAHRRRWRRAIIDSEILTPKF